ncbi:stabilizer of axonemal microtubules 1-like [Rhinatrema bivittatum]|uniref:stabilizer of axonemal microtubules 1-like n=1 Tax=Rhinatrema bivittatum TaxID=194408 RepID=UPI00112E3AC2|nr:stabilizer of axonemal microtubules 1-like [Rhinatrema bivittatum]
MTDLMDDSLIDGDNTPDDNERLIRSVKGLEISSLITFSEAVGRHHCPLLPTRIFEKVDKPRNFSEYSENYAQYQNIQPAVSCRPTDDYHKHTGRMEGKSIFGTDYVPHNVKARTPKKRVKYEPKTDKMDLHSTYNHDYHPYEIHPASSFKPSATKYGCTAKMDALSIYRDDYRQWQQAKRVSMKRDPMHQPPGIFDNTTTFRDDFQFKGPSHTQSFKPPNVARVASCPMEHLSDYKREYISFCLGKREARVKEKYKPSEVPFDGLTINRKDFRGVPGEAAKSLRPGFTVLTREGPFSNATEFQDQYRVWPQPPPNPKKSVTYIPPEDKMELLSTHKCDYTVHKVKPRSAFVPTTRARTTMPFNTNSTMREDYRPWKYGKPEAFKPKEEWQIPKDPFEGLTTFRSDYTEKPCPVTTSCKPSRPPIRVFLPLDAQSIYATSYTSKPINKCPAAFKDPPGYIYEITDASGHKLYRYVSKQDFTSLESMIEGTTAPVKDTILPEKAG